MSLDRRPQSPAIPASERQLKKGVQSPMTRLYDVPYGKLQEFLKRLSQAGFTADHLDELMQNQELTVKWVEWLDESRGEGLGDAVGTTVEQFFENDSRTWHPLAREGIRTVADLTDWSRDELLGIRTVGEKTVKRIETKLNRLGLALSNHAADDPDRIPDVNGRAWRRDDVYRLPIDRFVSRLDYLDLNLWIELGARGIRPTVGEIRQASDEALKRHLPPETCARVRNFLMKYGLSAA